MPFGFLDSVIKVAKPVVDIATDVAGVVLDIKNTNTARDIGRAQLENARAQRSLVDAERAAIENSTAFKAADKAALLERIDLLERTLELESVGVSPYDGGSDIVVSDDARPLGTMLVIGGIGYLLWNITKG